MMTLVFFASVLPLRFPLLNLCMRDRNDTLCQPLETLEWRLLWLRLWHFTHYSLSRGSAISPNQSFFIGQKILYVIEDFGTEKFLRMEPFIVTTHDDCNMSAGFSGSSFVGGREISTPTNSLSSIAVVGQTKDIEKVRPSMSPLLGVVAAGMLSNSLHCSLTSAPSFPLIETLTPLAPPLSTGPVSKCQSKNSPRTIRKISALIDLIGRLSGSIFASSKRASAAFLSRITARSLASAAALFASAALVFASPIDASCFALIIREVRIAPAPKTTVPAIKINDPHSKNEFKLSTEDKNFIVFAVACASLAIFSCLFCACALFVIYYKPSTPSATSLTLPVEGNHRPQDQ